MPSTRVRPQPTSAQGPPLHWVKGMVYLGVLFTVVGMMLMVAAYGVSAGLLAAFIAVGITMWSIGLCALTIAERERGRADTGRAGTARPTSWPDPLGLNRRESKSARPPSAGGHSARRCKNGHLLQPDTSWCHACPQ